VTGVLPDLSLRDLIASGAIAAATPIADAQIQPASLDLRLGPTAYRVRASFLAGHGRSVADRVAEFEMHRIDLRAGAVLEKGCVYVVPLLERLALPPGLSAVANAKSSTGRLDLLTRTITDGGTEFDRIPAATRVRSTPRSAPAPSRSSCARASGSTRSASATGGRNSPTTTSARSMRASASSRAGRR
jgi:hypothetical protein